MNYNIINIITQIVNILPGVCFTSSDFMQFIKLYKSKNIDTFEPLTYILFIIGNFSGLLFTNQLYSPNVLLAWMGPASMDSLVVAYSYYKKQEIKECIGFIIGFIIFTILFFTIRGENESKAFFCSEFTSFWDTAFFSGDKSEYLRLRLPALFSSPSKISFICNNSASYAIFEFINSLNLVCSCLSISDKLSLLSSSEFAFFSHCETLKRYLDANCLIFVSIS